MPSQTNIEQAREMVVHGLEAVERVIEKASQLPAQAGATMFKSVRDPKTQAAYEEGKACVTTAKNEVKESIATAQQKPTLAHP